MTKISEFLFAISDHGNVVISKAINYFGIAGIGGGAGMKVAEMARPELIDSTGLGLTDWAAIISIIGALTLVLKNAVDIYFSVRSDKRKQLEHEMAARFKAEQEKAEQKRASRKGA